METKPKPKPSAREKAEEFARNVPKPKLSQPLKAPPAERRPKEPPLADASAEAERDRADMEEIKRREKQHNEDVLRVKDIKDFLSQLPH